MSHTETGLKNTCAYGLSKVCRYPYPMTLRKESQLPRASSAAGPRKKAAALRQTVCRHTVSESSTAKLVRMTTDVPVRTGGPRRAAGAGRFSRTLSPRSRLWAVVGTL